MDISSLATTRTQPDQQGAYNSPCTLAQLSMKSILGIDNNPLSTQPISRISSHEAVEAALIIRGKTKSFSSKYDEPLPKTNSDDNGGKFCSIYGKFYCDDYKVLDNCEGATELQKCADNIERILSARTNYFLKYLPSDKDNECWSTHPIHKLVNSSDISNFSSNLCKLKDSILSLPELPSPGTDYNPETKSYSSSISYYLDPLYFLSTKCLYSKTSNHHYALMGSLSIYASLVMINLDKSISILENSNHIPGCICRLSIASLLQVKHTALKLKKLIATRQEKEHSSRRIILTKISLEIIIFTKKVSAEIEKLQETIIPLIECCNFLSLEDLLKIFEGKVSKTNEYLCKIKPSHLVDDPAISIDKERMETNRSSLEKEMGDISCFLKNKYQLLIPLKKSKIKRLRENIESIKQKIAHVDEETISKDLHILSLNDSVEKLEEEVKEMEKFICGNFSERYQRKRIIEEKSEGKRSRKMNI
ncbi:hypothetical protein [Candidatus Ichthyocystis sparus]|uniref:hypothetical protein n=1 Tax=Candidatus Ichthyocystis sparus TaxID=1561004 RepID=UPI000B897D63|nr:hypothetical protein [Candidatus Ichthyocystis sparus]